jgi:hypothetical protein
VKDDNRIDEFNFLWEPSSKWVLLHINSQKSNETPRYIIANIETSEALLIHDDNLYEKVKIMMMEKGSRITTSLEQES